MGHRSNKIAAVAGLAGVDQGGDLELAAIAAVVGLADVDQNLQLGAIAAELAGEDQGSTAAAIAESAIKRPWFQRRERPWLDGPKRRWFGRER